MISTLRKRSLLLLAAVTALALAAPAQSQPAGPRSTDGVASDDSLATPKAAPSAKPGKRFKPGARSLGDPLFPQIGNGGYDARSYVIDLDYDPERNSFAKGTRTKMRATATQNLSSFSLDFQDLKVSDVHVNGKPAKFRQVDAKPDFSDNPAVTQPMKLIVKPKRGIREGRHFRVKVSYRGRPEEITDADESIEGWVRACSRPANCDGSFVVNEPIGAQSWFPSNDYATDKARFETAITVPSTHVALGVGELTDKQRNRRKRTTTWTWSEDDPTATYLTSATVGRFDYAKTKMIEASTGRRLPIYTAIDSAGTAEQKATIAARAARIPEMTNFLSDRFGPYPFDSTGLVADWAPNVGYALENQTKPHFAGSDAGPGVGSSTLLHELAHQWMGDSVSPATWLEIWFNEGWATFTEVYWDFNANGSTYSPEQFFDDVYAEPEQKWKIAPAVLDGDPANLFAGFPIYSRSGAMLEGYREIVGDARTFRLARSLQKRYGYDTVSTDQFIALAKQRSGLAGAELAKLDDYFQQWLYGETKPTLTPDDFAP